MFDLTGDLQGRARLVLNGDIAAEGEVPKMWRLYAASAGVRCGSCGSGAEGRRTRQRGERK